MARKNGKSPSSLETDLLQKGEKFSFFQVVRLLQLLNRSNPNQSSEEHGPDRSINIRPHLSLGFPATDVIGVEERPGGFSIIASFLGLYGASSPLPTFYTEDIFNDIRDDSTATRDFLDIVHQRLYSFLIACWQKNRIFIQVCEEDAQRFVDLLYALSGLVPTGDNDEETYALIRYTGLFGRHPISALGLEALLADWMRGEVPVRIIEWVPRIVKIPAERRLCMGIEGANLGVDSFVGQELVDHQSKFRVSLGPLSADRFISLMHGKEKKMLARIMKRAMSEALEYDFEFILAQDQIKPARLGGPQWSTLGLDTAIFTGKYPGDLSVIFPSEITQWTS